jgi:LPXTG-motif cell wall-anchored protein
MNAAIFAGLFVVIVLGGWFVVANKKKNKDKSAK